MSYSCIKTPNRIYRVQLNACNVYFHRMEELPLPCDNVITAYLHVSTIILSHENDVVTLFGLYTDLADGSRETIEFHLSFYQLNELLSLINLQADNTVEQIANALNDPADDHTIINLAGEGGLHFYDYIFSFQAIYEEDEAGGHLVPEMRTYLLLAYMPLNGLLPYFIHNNLPEGKEYLDYLNKVLAAKYRLYLHLANMLTEEQGRACSGLYDPVKFAMAKQYYRLFT